MRRSFCVDVDSALRDPGPGSLIDEADLTDLPSTIRRYLRTTGALGQPRVLNMKVRMHGRIRSGVEAPWMPFTAEQYSVFGQRARYFYMKASRWLVPIHVYHRYVGTAATMQVKAFDQVPIANASGPEMTKAETVTMFNDMCVLAPATLIDSGIQWDARDETLTRAAFTNAGHTIEADGSRHVLPWSTPMRDYRAFGQARIGSRGVAIWDQPDGPFAYVEIEVDEIAYNVAHR